MLYRYNKDDKWKCNKVPKQCYSNNKITRDLLAIAKFLVKWPQKVVSFDELSLIIHIQLSHVWNVDSGVTTWGGEI